MNKKAIVTGCHGQDGSYLAELLLKKNYEVFGVSRRCSSRTNNYLYEALRNKNFKLVDLDITDATGVSNLISDIKPHEYYNLAAASHVGQSFKEPLVSLKNNGEAVAIALESILRNSPKTRFYQASTSELFGNSNGPQNEETKFDPRSPYAAAKLYAHEMVGLYRSAYGLHASCGILFNHESPRRGYDFVTRKITQGVVRYLQHGDKFTIGNLEAKRDWGHAKEYVQAMWMMLQVDEADDYVIGTGETASIRQAIKHVCALASLKDGDIPYTEDSNLLRPAEVNLLLADPSKAYTKLNWKAKCNWECVLEDMFAHDVSSVYL